jgi:hypothetical protein
MAKVAGSKTAMVSLFFMASAQDDTLLNKSSLGKEEVLVSMFCFLTDLFQFLALGNEMIKEIKKSMFMLWIAS